MQIVIDIDDEQILFDIKNQGLEGESETDKVIINALYNGTILPKHGRLIDADNLIELQGKKGDRRMTNQQKFIEIFGIDAWQQMIVFMGLAEQYKEYWTSPYKEVEE